MVFFLVIMVFVWFLWFVLLFGKSGKMDRWKKVGVLLFNKVGILFIYWDDILVRIEGGKSFE